MKKIYLVLLACVALTCVNAQKGNSFKESRLNGRMMRRPLLNGLGGSCDTLNFPVPKSWGAAIYLELDTTVGGFLTGDNGYGDEAKAQYFDASSTNDNYITQAWIGFGYANTNDTTKVVPVDVYDGTGDTVGALLGTTSMLTMGTIMNDIDSNFYSQVVFNPPIQLPASKQFLVGVDLTNLSWTRFQHDSLAVLSSLVDSASGAWELNSPTYGGNWASFLDDYTINLGLYIHPFVSADPTCSSSLPVHLISFTGQTKDNDVLLNWQVTQELNMKEYDVERASSNLQFSYLGAVQATNSTLNHTYSYTDANALSGISGSLYYRLKQVNKDGSISYSNVIKVSGSSGALSIKVVNPFNNIVQLHISSPVTQTMQAAIYDLQGRKIAELGTQSLSTGDNLVNMQAGGLPKGIYILTVTTGSTVYKYKILN